MTIRVSRKKADAYQHGDLRNALIQAGLKLLSESGVGGLSLRAAAELAGVSHAAPYRHFADKDALVAAIAEEGFRLLTRRMHDAIDASGSNDPLARLQASALGYVAFAVEHPGYFRTIFGGVVCEEGKAASPSLRAAGEEAYHVLRDLVSQGIERGRLRAGDPELVSLAAWSLVHGLGMLIIDGQVRDPGGAAPHVGKITESVVRLLMTGLRA
ncbi:MAG TPA: TetR/AcrR family transcriptional regulator [Polyangia bacterium]|jgi:AcrR family transcriptional regulator|nr:TetR/AcrR family transcriptional regulator [Polyangia bacterium]